MKDLLRRLNKIEKGMKDRLPMPDYDEDNFIKALGVNPEDFKAPGGGYDMFSALEAVVDNSDWNES